jgi:hypothetical protein
MGLVVQRDPAKHRETRKSLSHAFSAKVFKLQTDIVLKYVGMWVEQVKRLGNTVEGINTEEVNHVEQNPWSETNRSVVQLAHIRYNRRPSIWRTIWISGKS